MLCLEVDSPAVLAVFGVVNAESFSIFVAALLIGARPCGGAGADTAALLVPSVHHHGLAVNGDRLTLAHSRFLDPSLRGCDVQTFARRWTWILRRTLAIVFRRSGGNTSDVGFVVNHFGGQFPEEDGRSHIRTSAALAEEVRINNTHTEQSHVDAGAPAFGDRLPFNLQIILSDAVVAVNHGAVVAVLGRAVWLCDGEINVFR